MRIIFYEIRKLINWKVIGLLVLLSFLFYHLFLNFHFDYFPNGRPAGDHFKIAKQMIAKYGSEMDEKEFADFKEIYKEEVKKAGEYLKSYEGFSKAGVTTYEEFRNIDHDSSPKLDELYNEIIFEKGVDIFWELQAREGIIDRYEHNKEHMLNDPNLDEDWKKQYIESDSSNAILPYSVVRNYNELITMVGILIVLSVMVVIGRIHIIDQKVNVITLQYTTMEGRNLFKKKMIASMIMAIVIATVYLGVFFLMYAKNGTSEFFAYSLYSFEVSYYWFDITFLEYIILTVMGIYILVLVAAAIATILSRIVVNYISLIGAQIPVAVILILLIMEYLITRLFGIQYPVYLTIGTYIGLMVFGFTVLFLRWKKEKRVDII